MRWDILVFVILCISLAYSVYFLLTLLPQQAQAFTQITSINNNNLDAGIQNFSQIQQFYPNMRFQKLPITYQTESSCSLKKIRKMDQAIQIIENKTILKFQKVNVENEVFISCSEDTFFTTQTMFIAGEGGPTAIINTTLYSVILNGSILLFKESLCEEPVVELHEMFHVLGFEHSDNPNSIMYNTTKCNQKIDREIIEKLNSLYNAEPLADLFFENIQANKTGRYINFEVEIGNRGLVDTGEITLDLYITRPNGKQEKIRTFEISEVNIGYRRILSVQNLRSPYSFTGIKFIIDEENQIKEVYENNNIIEMAIED